MQTCSEGSVFAFSSLGSNSKWMDLLPTLCCFSWNMRHSTYFLACLLPFLHACQLNCLLAYFPVCIQLHTHLPLLILLLLCLQWVVKSWLLFPYVSWISPEAWLREEGSPKAKWPNHLGKLNANAHSKSPKAHCWQRIRRKCFTWNKPYRNLPHLASTLHPEHISANIKPLDPW